MIIRGQWLWAGGVARPVVKAIVAGAYGKWLDVDFLVDTGADRTVLSAATLGQLALTATESGCNSAASVAKPRRSPW